MNSTPVDPISAFRAVDLSPVARLESVWSDQANLDIAELNGGISTEIIEQVVSLRSDSHPLVRVVVGSAGTGKTHLLGRIRRALRGDVQFILVDMTGVDDFWQTTTLYLLQSLEQEFSDSELPCTQLELVLAGVYRSVYVTDDSLAALGIIRKIAGDPDAIDAFIEKFRMTQARPLRSTRGYVLRGLLGLLSEDSNVADSFHAWLRGIVLDADGARSLGVPQELARIEIVQSVLYLMSRRGPTLIAFDQMDSIVREKELASQNDAQSDRAEAALAVVQQIAGGIADLWERAHATLILVTCLEQSWNSIRKQILEPTAHRFEKKPRVLEVIPSPRVGRDLVRARLQQAYERVGFQPLYPTFPFRESFFDVVGRRPRQLLVECNEHLQRCIEERTVHELESPVVPTEKLALPPSFELDEAYNQALARAEPAAFLDPANEAELGELSVNLCELLLKEVPPPSNVDAEITSAVKKKKIPGLHARLRLVFHDDGEREEHFCLRALQATNPNAFLARITAAVTDSGLDLRLGFRRLTLLRTTPCPHGPKCTQALTNLTELGGRFVSITADEVRTIIALYKVLDQYPVEFGPWIQKRKFATSLRIAQAVFSDYLQRIPSSADDFSREHVEPPASFTLPPERDPKPVPQQTVTDLLIGWREGIGEIERLQLSVNALSCHVVIRAGSGSGKTVLLKRLVEEAALARVPSIVLDGAGDLVFLADPSSSPSPHWLEGDNERAERYQHSADVVVWTPGVQAGRPLRLAALPDFSGLAGDDLEQAVQMGVESLEDAAGADGAKAGLRRAILTKALRYFANRGFGSLQHLIRVLSELPQEAASGIAKEEKLAAEMADCLRAAITNDRLLASSSRGTDPGELLRSKSEGKTRVSVISLAGLTETERPRLVNQLAMSLFTWMRSNPPSGTARMNGLLVIDEAKDFLPSVRTTPCKQSLMRLAAQARKYGVGMLIATQNPKDLDYNAVAQFATHFYGRASAPQSIDLIRKAIEDRGGHAPDIANLPKGTFYFTSSEGYPKPIRVTTPMCLSSHPDQQTATDEQVLRLARRAI